MSEIIVICFALFMTFIICCMMVKQFKNELSRTLNRDETVQDDTAVILDIVKPPPNDDVEYEPPSYNEIVK